MALSLNPKSVQPNATLTPMPSLPTIGSVQRCRLTGSGLEFDAVVCDIVHDSVYFKPTRPMPENWQSMGPVEFLPANKEQS